MKIILRSKDGFDNEVNIFARPGDMIPVKYIRVHYKKDFETLTPSEVNYWQPTPKRIYEYDGIIRGEDPVYEEIGDT